MESSPLPNIRSLLSLSLPLIIAGLSSNLTIFADRIILSDFSVEMMSHVTTISNHCWVFLFTVTGITHISKAFVGQYNGSKQYHMSSVITWQMIFISLISIFLFLFAYSIAPYILPTIAHKHGIIYFKTLMLCGVLWPISSSLHGFFVGTYQNKVVFSTLILSNTINIMLDLLWIPQYGTYGAALATNVSMFAQVLILFYFYLGKRNHSKYQTRNVILDIKLMKKGFRLGYPDSMAHFFEMAAWACIITIIASKGSEFLLVSNLAQNIFILFMFVYSELGNAVKAMASNYIGENRAYLIPKLLTSAFSVHTAFMIFIAACFIYSPNMFIALFSLEQESVYLKMQAIHSLKGIFFFMFLDGIAYIISSVLSAYGYTFVNMVLTGTNMWLFLVLPTYLLINFYPCTESTHSLVVLPLYGICITASFILRYYSSRASKENLVQTESLP